MGRTAAVRDNYREDIEGLRAIAVGLVLMFHAGVPGFGGGFVGVDVFFVLSGFLITGLLVDEVAATGTIRLRRFYARRIRRLLPASAAVALVCLVWAALTFSPLRMIELRGEALATVTYLANVHFAVRGADYFADESASPFAHYWSLALEEQFYVLWPVVILVIAWLVARLRRDLEEYVSAALLLVVAASLTASVVLTQVRPSMAFFLLPARAWELAAGGLLAIVIRRRGAARSHWARLIYLGGLVAVLAAAVTFGESTPFPGTAALLPVIGTLGLIFGGCAKQPAQRAVSSTVSRWIGQRSYSIYLWHWPILVFGGPDLRLASRLLLVVLSVAAAHVTFELVENPLRHDRRLSQRPLASGVFGTLLTAACVLVALAVTTPSDLDAGVVVESATPDRLSLLLSQPTPVVPSNLRPPLLEARDALAATYRDGCHRNFAETSVVGCDYGPVDAPVTVFLFGDSHAASWFPALHLVAEHRGWRLVSMTKSACSAVDAPAYLTQFEQAYPACDRWRSNVHDRVVSERPDVVVVANHSQGSRQGHTRERWLDGLGRTLTRLAVTSRPVLLSGTPNQGLDPAHCLSANLQGAAHCATATGDGIDGGMQGGEARVATLAGAHYVHTAELVCGPEVCPVIVGDVLAYRDTHHLTPQFVQLMAPTLDAVLAAVVE